eukprot:1772382-Pleurochrysis_carterae.AAC.1
MCGYRNIPRRRRPARGTHRASNLWPSVSDSPFFYPPVVLLTCLVSVLGWWAGRKTRERSRRGRAPSCARVAVRGHVAPP